MLEDISCLLSRRSHRVLAFIIFSGLILSFSGISVYSQETADTTATVSAAAPDDGISIDPDLIAAGETLFNNYCKVCHAVDREVIGPALAGVYERLELPWIIAFVQNSQKVIESGDAYAVQVYEQYNKTQMPSHDLSEDEVMAILSYVKDQTLNPPAAAMDMTGTAGEAGAAPSGLSISSGFLISAMVGLVIILVLILIVLVMLVQTLTRFMKQNKSPGLSP